MKKAILYVTLFMMVTVSLFLSWSLWKISGQALEQLHEKNIERAELRRSLTALKPRDCDPITKFSSYWENCLRRTVKTQADVAECVRQHKTRPWIEKVFRRESICTILNNEIES